MSGAACETCGCPLEAVYGDHVGHEEMSGDGACIAYLKAKVKAHVRHEEELRVRGVLVCPPRDWR